MHPTPASQEAAEGRTALHNVWERSKWKGIEHMEVFDVFDVFDTIPLIPLPALPRAPFSPIKAPTSLLCHAHK
jgi:hypothetical protein